MDLIFSPEEQILLATLVPDASKNVQSSCTVFGSAFLLSSKQGKVRLGHATVPLLGPVCPH